MKFSIYYNKISEKAEVISRGKVYLVKNIECYVPLHSEYSRITPKFRLTGVCNELIFEQDKIIMK